MADIADLGTETADLLLDAAMRTQQAEAAAAPRIHPRGYCHNPACQDDLDDGKLFCGADCANEYERFTFKR